MTRQVIELEFEGAPDDRMRAAALRRLIAQSAGTPTRIVLPDGRYQWEEALQLGVENSDLELYARHPGRVSFSGGRRLTGWQQEGELWRCDVAAVEEFDFLYLNGERRERGRYPASGYLRGQVSGTRLNGTIPAALVTPELAREAELVLDYDWLCQRLRLTALDENGADFISNGSHPIEKVWFHLENLPETALAAGQWHCDAATRQLFYRPLDGEVLAESEFIAAVTPQLLRVTGEPEKGRYVERIRLSGIVFEHTGDRARPASSQAEWQVSGAIAWRGVRSSAIEHCTVAHTSGWAIDIGEGCRRIAVANNRLLDLGAGGIQISGAPDAASPLATAGNRVERNLIRGGGRFFHGAVGVLLRLAFDNVIADNEITELHYTGISCGWSWGYAPHVSRDNRIVGNHIHHLGQERILIDAGAIYTLGIQPGTVIADNVIHDIDGEYITWGIYLDEGSSDMVVENNLVYRVASECFRLHYGRNNLIRNNVFALGGNAVVSTTRGTMDMQCNFQPGDRALTFEHNVLITDGKPFLIKYILDYKVKEDLSSVASDYNILQSLSSPFAPIIGEEYHMFRDDYRHLHDAASAKRVWRMEGHSYFTTAPDLLADPEAAARMNATTRRLYQRFLDAQAKGE